MMLMSHISISRVSVSCFSYAPKRILQPGVLIFKTKINFRILQSTHKRSPFLSRTRIPLIEECLERSFEDFNGRPGPAVKEKHSIVWFRNDLRLHDNEVLTTANHQSSTLLPIYIFDPRDYSTRACRFSKIGPFRAQFILESVRNLRRNLERLGSKLFVRIGRPEEIIPSIVKRISATEVYCQEEYSKENVQRQNSLSDALGEMGVRLKKLSSSTMYHKEDLPFKIDSLPSTFGEFAKQVKSVCIREALKAPNELKTIPKTILNEEKIPTLKDLGFSDSVNSYITQQSTQNQLKGGECRALEHIKTSSCQFATINLSSWMSFGCLSPRYLYYMTKSSQEDCKINDDLKSELVWRDFYQFSFLKNATHSTVKTQTVPKSYISF